MNRENEFFILFFFFFLNKLSTFHIVLFVPVEKKNLSSEG